MQYPASELVLNNKGEVYHLGLSPEQIAHKIILVGDQDRVNLVSNFFDKVEHQSQHREFRCHTGTYQGKRISVLSSGIGTDNIDIVLNELDALVNIDLEQRKDKDVKTALEIVRIGTCGILQADIPVHSYILSSHAVGLDNIAHFYEVPFTNEEEELTKAIQSQLELPKNIIPYAIQASEELVARFSDENHTVQGITVTSSGFYGPQGRQLRLTTKSEKMNDSIERFSYQDLHIVNFEMESSALFALGKSLGHECTTICLGIANRPNKAFSKGYTTEMNQLISFVLDRI